MASRIRRFKDLVHPELRKVRYLPPLPINSFTLPFVRLLVRLLKYLLRPSRPVPGLLTKVVSIPTLDGSGIIPAYLARPDPSDSSTGKGSRPGLIWIHGGGMILGSYAQDVPRIHAWASPDPDCFVDGAVIVAPDYRLALAHPAPALVDDCFATWMYLVDNADTLGVDTNRLVVAGASAGGGLAASLCQRILDYSKSHPDHPTPKLQLLNYPMLDDRTVPRIEQQRQQGRYQDVYPVWTPGSNRLGWTSYLGGLNPGGDPPEQIQRDIPARRKDLAGLPNTWIGVGSLDLFHDEDVEYARRLREAGAEVQLDIVQGGFHAMEMFKNTAVVKQYEAAQRKALRGV